MGRKIPDHIRLKVLIAWLEGVPRQQIARDNQIGTGTVSEIIKAIKEKDSDARIDVLRVTALILEEKARTQILYWNQYALKISWMK